MYMYLYICTYTYDLYIILYYIILHYSIVYYIVLYYIILYYICQQNILCTCPPVKTTTKEGFPQPPNLLGREVNKRFAARHRAIQTKFGLKKYRTQNIPKHRTNTQPAAFYYQLY